MYVYMELGKPVCTRAGGPLASWSKNTLIGRLNNPYICIVKKTLQ